MKSAACWAGGYGRSKRHEYETEVPGGRQTNIVPLVAVPVVVDIEALGIEVAHVDAVAVGATRNCSLPS